MFCFAIANSSSAADQVYKVNLPNGKAIKAELAIDKTRGLQGRKHLCTQCGMIFVFEDESIHNFWMKDTLINLAIIWIDSKGTITHIVNNAQPCSYTDNPYEECKIYTTNKASKYVLEINPSDAKNLNPGMKVDILFRQ